VHKLIKILLSLRGGVLPEVCIQFLRIYRRLRSMLSVRFETIMNGLLVVGRATICKLVLLDDLESLGARSLVGALVETNLLRVLVLVRHLLFLKLERLFATCVNWKCLHYQFDLQTLLIY
jgi:hypothetical protein